MRTRITLVGFCLTALCHPQTAPLQQSSASSIVSDFCRFDANGKRLNSSLAKEIAKTLLVERPWEEPLEVVIIKDYSARAITEQKNASQFVADYRVLGRLDSSLLLTRMQVPYSDHAPVQSEHFSLILTDTHTEVGLDGRQQLTKGAPEWRIQSYPSQPHVGINAAIAYVRMMGYRAKDVRVKMNAEKTLAELQQLLAAPSNVPQLADPKEIVSQFIEMQMGVLGVRPEIAGQMSAFLVHPESKRNDKIGVARAYAVNKITFAANKAIVSVELGAIGEIDSHLGFTRLGERGTVVQQDYKLVLDNKYPLPAYGDKPASEIIGPSRWRIEETPPEEWVSPATAIEYVTQIRNASRDPSIKENADKSLAVLTSLR